MLDGLKRARGAPRHCERRKACAGFACAPRGAKRDVGVGCRRAGARRYKPGPLWGRARSLPKVGRMAAVSARWALGDLFRFVIHVHEHYASIGTVACAAMSPRWGLDGMFAIGYPGRRTIRHRRTVPLAWADI